jgi:hypothetical protein
VELLVVNEKDPVPPLPGTLADPGLMETVVAACVNVNVAPVPLVGVTVITAVRLTVPIFPVAVY